MKEAAPNGIHGHFLGCDHCVHAAVFALRCGAGSGAGARVGHGSDRSRPDRGLCSTLEEQVRRHQ